MKRHLLLVEDNPKDEALTLRAFRKCNVANEIVVVRDGAEALDYLFCVGAYADRDIAHLPAAVLLDLSLPKVSGIDVLARIRGDARTKTLPVVILSASNEESDRATCYQCGANSYVRKPVDFEEFIHAAAQIGLYWVLLNAPAPDLAEKTL